MGFLATLPDWLWLTLTIMSVVAFVGSLFVLRILIIRMPHDYFVGRRPPESRWANRSPAVRMTLLIAKNVVGTLLVVFGVLMLFTPGQGILSILIGLSMLNVPGKRAFERRLVGNPVVLRTLNRIRTRAGQPPLVIDQRGHRAAASGN
jgi:hypothetical protein